MSPALGPRSYQYFPHFAPVLKRARLRGLGTTMTPAQMAQQIGGITGTAATGAISALSLAGVIGLSTAWIPVIGAGIAAVTAGISLILNSGCGQTCIVTSNWANQAEQLLQQNIQSYFGLPTPRSQTAQKVALANFDNVWNYLVQECGQAQLGTAGVNCTRDRMRGACTWRQRADSPLLQYPGEPQAGECWNWFSGYRDPIAMDPAVPDEVAVPATGADTGTNTVSASAPAGSKLILYAGIGLLALGVIGGIR